jgi:predicted Zn-dependent protease
MILVLAIAAITFLQAEENSAARMSETGFHVPCGSLSQLPLSVTLPHVMPPVRKLDPKYDVTKIGNRNVAAGLDFYSRQREIELGRALAQQVDASVRLVKDPVVTEYINRIGQELVRNSDATVPFTIKVIDDDQVNAFALPGGYFYVNSGLILAADNEAGLAGVMAHEIAHVAARHATKNQTRSDLLNIASVPLMFFGGPAAMLLRSAMNIAVPMGFLKFGRDAEREADLLGIEYEYAAGYDPEEFVKFFEKIHSREKEKKSFVAKAFTTHPMTGERIKRAQKEIAEYLPAREDYVVDTSEFEAVRVRLVDLSNRRRTDLGKISPVLIKRDSKRRQDDGNRPTLHRQ